MKRRFWRGSVVLFATAVLACAGSPTGLTPLPAGGRHVLFVGNSLTATNDLPSVVAAIAASVGDTVRVMAMVGANLALIDHLNGATQVTSAIKLGGWDYVVLQQGPTTVGVCRDSLVLWAQMYDTLVRANGGVPAFFMTWPALGSSSTTFDAVRTSFEDAAIKTAGVFLPAGEAWRAAWAVNPVLPLYGDDGFHPSPLGTYLAALEIYERISGKDARTLPKAVLNAPDSIFTQMQNAAHAANVNFPAHPTRAITPPSGGTVAGGHC
jgi:hypothetical protein